MMMSSNCSTGNLKIDGSLEMPAFDRLPGQLRERLRNALVAFSAQQAAELQQVHGIEGTIEMMARAEQRYCGTCWEEQQQ